MLLLNKKITIPRFPHQFAQYIKGIFNPSRGNKVAKMLVPGFYLPIIDHSIELSSACPNIKPRDQADKLADIRGFTPAVIQ